MIDAPLALHESTVPADWIDYNGHMTESSYLLLVGNAADAFFRYIGIDEAYRAAGRSLYTAEQLLVHVDMASGRVTPMPEELHGRLMEICKAHAMLPRPAAVGHVMGIRRPE